MSDYREIMFKLADMLRSKAGNINPSYWRESDAAPWQLADTAKESAKFEVYHELADLIDDIIAVKSLTDEKIDNTK